MKKQLKIKNAPIRKAKERPCPSAQAATLAHSSRPGLRHFRLVEHKHTGKLIHRRHTSHLALVVILLIVGLLLFFSGNTAGVQQTASGDVSVGVVVPGPAPTVGATIITPKDGTSLIDQDIIEVSGTCAPGTFVVIKNNDELAGSTVCTNAGIFILQIQLRPGKNVLSALNYDNLNQPGPNTPLISVNLTKSNGSVNQPLPIKSGGPILLPSNPSVVPGPDFKTVSCGNATEQSLPVGGIPRVVVVCIPRFIQSNRQYTLDVMAWGGSPPYALVIDWGNETEDTILSLVGPGSRTVKFNYDSAGVYTITIRLTDKDGQSALVQTAVQVSGEDKTPFAAFTGSLLSNSWFNTPVPLYLTAVVVTLGFWGGDFFDRNFGARKHKRSSRRTV